MDKTDRRILGWILFLIGIIWSLRSLALLIYITFADIPFFYGNERNGAFISLFLQLLISVPMIFWGDSHLKIIGNSRQKKVSISKNIQLERNKVFAEGNIENKILIPAAKFTLILAGGFILFVIAIAVVSFVN